MKSKNSFIIRWLINMAGLYLAVTFVDGVELASTDWVNFLWLALILGFLNALVRPFLVMLTCPLLILTLGLGTLVLNTVMLYLLEWFAGLVGIGFTISGFWPAFMGALIISVVSVLVTMVIKDDKRKK